MRGVQQEARVVTDDKSTKKSAASDDAGASNVQEKMDADLEQGFRGTAVDPTPNEAYTVAGVTSGMPTPETDADAAKAAREATGIGGTAQERAAEREAADKKG
jgi:hypothetical protein